MSAEVRQPVVAGMFYPAQKKHLESSLAVHLAQPLDVPHALLSAPVGLIAPHAGYMYSGDTAGAGYRAVSALGRPETVLVLGANHTGMGPNLCVDDRPAWRTPLGDARVNVEVIEELARAGLATERAPFDREHSIEVQIPFVQYVWGPGVSIVPILVQPSGAHVLARTSQVLTQVIARRPSTLLVASSDFTHYETDAAARDLDRHAIDRILGGEPDAFLSHCRAERLTICGTGAIALLMHISRALSLGDIRWIAYSTSGDATGDRSAVVGYASVMFTRRRDGS